MPTMRQDPVSGGIDFILTEDEKSVLTLKKELEHLKEEMSNQLAALDNSTKTSKKKVKK